MYTYRFDTFKKKWVIERGNVTIATFTHEWFAKEATLMLNERAFDVC